ncbi:Serine/threonine-protein kinase AFC3 [Ananas comosus]|uniref:Serine/threonine-protein kinase AFC3 n=1 Tax=Ananas comosus TaxID=4615 RepID=A0A199V5G0_ANACO|nr:Serine/threonine-protein kinase AFC3 [Ananas comosus]
MESSRTRKRQRHAWDAAPSEREAARGEAAPVARGAASPPWRDDDREGHYVFDLGENLTPRYKILSKIGEGTFGRVLECWDRETRDYVAIKVVRSIRKYREAAMLEIDVLNLLGKNDRHGSRCVQLRRWFDYRNHICILAEQFLGFYRGSHKMRFTSSACQVKFRVELSCDMWSIGCILVELLSVHLAMMERVLGPIPEHMIRKASSNASKYFRRGTRLNWPKVRCREKHKSSKELNRLKEFVSQYVDHSSTLLTDLLYGLLRFEPSERLTAQEALNHTFFKAAV